ncbi:MAG: DUF5719 family protein [Nitriliruptoraceae bacterium]
MNVRRVVLPAVLVVAVVVYVLSIDAMVGPVEPEAISVDPSVVVEPLSGTVLCTVGVGGLGAPSIAAPDLEPPAADAQDEGEEAPDEPDEADEAADGEEDAADGEEAPDAPDEAGDGEEDAADGEDGEEDAEDGEEDADDGDTGEQEVPVATIIAALPGRPGGGTPALLERTDLLEEDFTTTSLPSVFPGGDVRFDALGADGPAATSVRWRNAAVAVTREWRVEDVPALPSGTVAGGCADSGAGTHLVPGLSTTGGDEARLRLANPHRSPASVAVRFATPGDPEAPLVLQNLSVPPGAVREVVVNDVLPERDDLAAVVEVTSGRIAVEGMQLSRAAIGGVDGMSLLAATSSPAEDWTVTWLADDDTTSGWLWVLNTGDRTAAVQLSLHTADGGEVPFGLSEVSVPAGELRRVDMTGTFPDEVDEVAVTARSNGVPIVVSGAVQRVDEDSERTGVTVQLGARSDPRWVVSGVGAQGRDEQLRIVNPEGEPAVLEVAFLDGVRVRTPDELREVEVPPGSTTTIDLASYVSVSAPWTAFVTAREGAVVVGLLGVDTGDGPLHLVSASGVASSSWLTTGSGLLPVQRPGLVTQLGTSGPRAPDGVPGGLIGSEPEDGTGEDPDADPPEPAPTAPTAP